MRWSGCFCGFDGDDEIEVREMFKGKGCTPLCGVEGGVTVARGLVIPKTRVAVIRGYWGLAGDGGNIAHEVVSSFIAQITWYWRVRAAVVSSPCKLRKELRRPCHKTCHHIGHSSEAQGLLSRYKYNKEKGQRPSTQMFDRRNQRKVQ